MTLADKIPLIFEKSHAQQPHERVCWQFAIQRLLLFMFHPANITLVFSFDFDLITSPLKGLWEGLTPPKGKSGQENRGRGEHDQGREEEAGGALGHASESEETGWQEEGHHKGAACPPRIPPRTGPPMVCFCCKASSPPMPSKCHRLRSAQNVEPVLAVAGLVTIDVLRKPNMGATDPCPVAAALLRPKGEPHTRHM